jgi:hypothetical protein
MTTAFRVFAILTAALLAWSGIAIAAPPNPRCQRAVARAGGSFVMKSLKLGQRCALRTAAGNRAVCRPRAATLAGDARTAAAIGRATTRLGKLVARGCAGGDISAYGRRCPDASGPPLSVAELVTCLRDSHLDRVGAMIAVQFPVGNPGATATGECAAGETCQCSCLSPSGAFIDASAAAR